MGGFRGVELNPIRVKSWQKVLLENEFDLREDEEERPKIHGNGDRSRWYVIKADGIEIPVLEHWKNTSGDFSVLFVTFDKETRPIVKRLIEVLELHCT